MPRYFIKISFDGTNYSGWQVQENTANTVQQKINEGLSKLLNEKIIVQGCCRTDTGVHAKELYAHFDTGKNLASPLNPLSLRRGEKGKGDVWGEVRHKFNSILPFDISIDEIYPVSSTANARFDATARTYQYYIHGKRNPFLINRSYYYYSELDVALMNKAAAALKKCNDFSAFSKVNTQVKTNKCRIYNAEWEKVPPKSSPLGRTYYSPLLMGGDGGGLDILVFTIRADRFLRGMVRMIVGTMMLVGKHKITLQDFQKIIDSKDCRNAGVSVPACGLYLMKVEYPKKIFISSKYEKSTNIRSTNLK